MVDRVPHLGPESSAHLACSSSTVSTGVLAPHSPAVVAAQASTAASVEIAASTGPPS